MRIYYRSLPVFFILLLVHFSSLAQLDIMFAAFDCRQHAEWFYDEPVVAFEDEIITIDSSLLFVAEPVITIDTVNGWKSWSYVENYTFGKDRGSLPMITDLQALHPFFRDRIVELIKNCKEKGIELAIVETYRTHAKQNEYKGMGKKYTNSAGGKSKHQYGLAVDVVPIVDSVAVWDNAALWRKVGLMGEKLGLRWGGRWKKPYDPGHFEWTGGLTSSHLSHGTFPVLPTFEEHYPCVEEDIKLLQRYWKEWETSQSSLTRK